jgi:TRAP-type C4-dicarboxylate transport system substrate-binding protein
MKRILTLLLCMAIVLSMAACGGTGTPSGEQQNNGSDDVEQVVISIATPAADGNPMQELVYYFEEQVDELLPGRVEWRNYPNSAMGSEREIGEQVIDGTLNAALVGPTNIPAFAPMDAVRLQDVPFLFQTQDELYDASDEWYADMINEECKEYGITTVFYEYIMGQEIENTKRPIYTPEDVKGMKVRVYDSIGPYKFLEACKGLPVAMAFSEVYTGLQQGAVDGLYTTSSNFVPQKFVEVTKYHTKLTVTNCGMTLLFNLDFLNSLPQDLQDAIATAGKKTEEHCRNVVGPETRDKTYADIAAAGVEINEVSDEQYQVFVDTVADYCYDELRELIGADKWDFCVEWLENYRANQ